jgi:hypothetical protein
MRAAASSRRRTDRPTGAALRAGGAAAGIASIESKPSIIAQPLSSAYPFGAAPAFTRGMRSYALAVLLLTFGAPSCAKRAVPDASAVPVLWREPTATGPSAGRPMPPFRLVEEDRAGDSPKFSVVDGRGARWHVKLGPEAQAETAAVRLLEAVGYFTEPTYFLSRSRIEGIDALTRGRHLVLADGTIAGARFEARPDGIERGATWDWASNPFVGTEALDGLKVLMVLINNYDARTANNRILVTPNAAGLREARYVVTDLGASFGRYGGLGGHRSKNDVKGYRASAFIERVEDGRVHFAYRTRPEGWGLTLFLFNPFYTAGELKKQRDMSEVSVEGARWIGARLARLPDTALAAAFESAGYAAESVAALVGVVRARIQALRRL